MRTMRIPKFLLGPPNSSAFLSGVYMLVILGKLLPINFVEIKDNKIQPKRTIRRMLATSVMVLVITTVSLTLLYR
jgi:hypothetical protein